MTTEAVPGVRVTLMAEEVLRLKASRPVTDSNCAPDVSATPRRAKLPVVSERGCVSRVPLPAPPEPWRVVGSRLAYLPLMSIWAAPVEKPSLGQVTEKAGAV